MQAYYIRLKLASYLTFLPSNTYTTYGVEPDVIKITHELDELE